MPLFRTEMFIAGATFGALLFALDAHGADTSSGRNLAAACASCHGPNGNSVDGMAPLAGVSKSVLLDKMRDFRSGAAPATVMQQIAKGYSDRQLDLIAAYFASQKPTQRP